MFFTSNLSGYGADRLISSGADKTRVRKIMQTIGFIGPSLFLVCTIFAWSAFSATLFITLGLGLHAFSHAGVYCNHQDISSGKAIAGVLLGLSNTSLLTVFLFSVDTSTCGGPGTDSFSVTDFCFVFCSCVYPRYLRCSYRRPSCGYQWRKLEPNISWDYRSVFTRNCSVFVVWFICQDLLAFMVHCLFFL